MDNAPYPMRLLFLLATALGLGGCAGLEDHAVGAMALQSLNGAEWQLEHVFDNTTSLRLRNVVVPGDLITDLQRAGLVGDPLFELNFQDRVWEGAQPWHYTIAFDLNPDIADSLTTGGEVWLIFDSVKLAADITLNGQVVGETRDQFLRYEFNVQQLLRPSANTLVVSFPNASDPRNAEGRSMACSGAWDWAPYSSTFLSSGTPSFSKGLVKSVYLAAAHPAIIRHVVPQIRYAGEYPTSPLSDGHSAAFDVSVRVVLAQQSARATQAKLEVVGSWPGAEALRQAVSIGPGETVVTVQLAPAEGVALWWPAGIGAHTLYNISVALQIQGQDQAVRAVRAVGFRAAYLVTANDSEPVDHLRGVDGSGEFTMRWRVNGANVWARGANMIPMEELEGRQLAEAYERLLMSAHEAGFNMLRVWGGGIFLPEVFYDTCDKLGIMVFQDLMYGTPWFGGTSGTPLATAMQVQEITHAVRRLAPHPSVVAWNGGNEWLGRMNWTDIFEGVIFPTLVAQDSTRALWPGSPSKGFSGGVERLTGLANGKPFRIRFTAKDTDEDEHEDGELRLPLFSPKSSPEIETHGPYEHGSGFKTRNGDGNEIPFDANQPPVLPSVHLPLGPSQPGTFASEFGCSVFSSFESMSPTLTPEHWSAHAPPMYERNYPTDNIVDVYFGSRAAALLNQTGREAFQGTTYLATLGSALNMKSDIEARRAGNNFGILVWQLNEIWPTGGWGSVEYGTPGWTPGQVLGGRWKPLHHFFAQHLYRSVVLICGDDATCILRNDGSTPVEGQFSLQFLHLATGKQSSLSAQHFSLPAGAGVAEWLCADGTTTVSSGCPSFATLLPQHGCATDGSDCLLLVQVVDSEGSTVLDEHTVLLTAPRAMALPAANVTASVGDELHADGSVDVTVSATGGTALFVTLTTLEQGRFSHNAFPLTPSAPRTLRFLPFDAEARPAALKASLRVEHVAMYA